MADLAAFLAEITLSLERPDEVADHPVREAVDVHLQLAVDLGAPGGQRAAERLETVDAPVAEVADVVDRFLQLEPFVVLHDHDHVVRVACVSVGVGRGVGMGVGVRREGRDAREWMYVMWGDEIRGRTTSLLHVEGEDVLQPAEMEK